jgi:transposase, IS30 family
VAGTPKYHANAETAGRIHTVSATSCWFGAPPGVRREFFDLVCLGMSLRQAERELGVSYQTGWQWWHNAGAMKLRGGKTTGLAHPGDLPRPGGRGYRLSFDEHDDVMRGLCAGRSYARIGRDCSVIWREVRRHRNPDGDYHARLAHARAAQAARRLKAFKLLEHPLCAAIEAWMNHGWSPQLVTQSGHVVM